MLMILSPRCTRTAALMPARNMGTRQIGSPVRALRQTTLPSPQAENRTRFPLYHPSTGCENELSLGWPPGVDVQTRSPVILSNA